MIAIDVINALQKCAMRILGYVSHFIHFELPFMAFLSLEISLTSSCKDYMFPQKRLNYMSYKSLVINIECTWTFLNSIFFFSFSLFP